MKIDEVEFRENLEKFRYKSIIDKYHLNSRYIIHEFLSEYIRGVVFQKSYDDTNIISFYFKDDEIIENIENLLDICKDIFPDSENIMYSNILGKSFRIYIYISDNVLLLAERKYKLKILEQYENK